jgi:flagellar motor switch protein FliM
MSDLLSQDEINALLQGVDDGDIETETDESHDKGSAKNYDFSSQEKIVRRRIPTLEMINFYTVHQKFSCLGFRLRSFPNM